MRVQVQGWCVEHAPMRVSLSETRRRVMRCFAEWGMRGRRSRYCTQPLAQHPARGTLGAGSRHPTSHVHPVRMDAASPTAGTDARVRSRASGREREKAVDARGDSDPQYGSRSMPAARSMRMRVSEGTHRRSESTSDRRRRYEADRCAGLSDSAGNDPVSMD